MKKKKVLVMTDSPFLHTGFGRVGKEIWTELNRTGKYDIKCLGWFHQPTNEGVTYSVVTTNKDEKGRILQSDKYGHESFPKYVDEFKPDLVWTLGDTWMTDHVATSPSRNSFKWIGYFPIDGCPSPSKWGKVIENMDIAVAYGKWGMEVIRQRAQKANLKYIYHGVDSERFRKKDSNAKLYDKRHLLGVPDDKFIIGVVARNQPRKAFDKIFEAYFYILNGEYFRCNKCNKITVRQYDIVNKKCADISRCKHCSSNELQKGSPRDDIRLYFHCAPVDCGWDLIDLQNDFNLAGKILVNPNLKIGVGVAEQTLVSVYNCFDIFTLPTRGEGFGLPILEAMSCEVPVVVTDYSAHTEWAGAGGILVPPITLEAEPMTNIRRAIVDMDLYVTALMDLVENKDLREKYGKAGREKAKEMDWKPITKQWETLVDSVLFPDGAPDKIDASKLEYSLEEI